MENNSFPELHIIHLPHREDRNTSILHELQLQGITRFRFWEGILDPLKPETSIAKAHQRIVADQKQEVAWGIDC